MQSLILSNDGFVELRNFSAIINLLLRIQVDRTIVHSQLIILEERDGCVLEVKMNNLGQHVSTLNLFCFAINSVAQESDFIDFCWFCHKYLILVLEFEEFFYVFLLCLVYGIAPSLHLIFAVNSLNDGL